jgi:hypothetical protein
MSRYVYALEANTMCVTFLKYIYCTMHIKFEAGAKTGSALHGGFGFSKMMRLPLRLLDTAVFSMYQYLLCNVQYRMLYSNNALFVYCNSCNNAPPPMFFYTGKICAFKNFCPLRVPLVIFDST